MIEILENRLLCRGAVINVHEGILRISCTTANDVLTLSGRSGRLVITLNTNRTTIRSQVHQATIFCGPGKDTVDAANSYIPVYVDGGTGKDHLVSSVGQDTLLGGSGNDILEGNFTIFSDTFDYLDGGLGDDQLFFGGVMHGGSGNDIGWTEDAPNTFITGLEALYAKDEETGVSSTIFDQASPDPDLDLPYENLYKRRGSMILDINNHNVHALGNSSPYTRSDGAFGVTIRVTDTITGSGQSVTASFNRTEALQSGIVLSYTYPDSARINPKLDRIVLLGSSHIA